MGNERHALQGRGVHYPWGRAGMDTPGWCENPLLPVAPASRRWGHGRDARATLSAGARISSCPQSSNGKPDIRSPRPWLDGSQANYWDSGDPYEDGDYPWTTPVGYYDGGQTPPGVDMANGYGLYDMAGNVWEWCHDRYDSDYYSVYPPDGWPPNPHGPASGTYRVLRGGSWHYHSDVSLRCADRYERSPVIRGDYLGFRVAAGT